MRARQSRPGLRLSTQRLLLSTAALLAIAGCQKPNADINADDPDMSAFIRLMMPAGVEIQHYLTKPFDFDNDGNADGIEAILEAHDSFGDPVKCVGTFNFELHTMRMASGDKVGRRIGFWSVKINSDRTLVEYWNRLTRSYRFPLQLSDGPLEPGRYIFSARLITPTSEKLYDTYEFSHEGS